VIQTVALQIDPDGINWDPVEHHVRCMEHALHLAAKHFVERVAPTSTSALLKKTVEDNDDETDFDVANTVGKALSLVTQI
jgi:hypothetical protein